MFTRVFSRRDECGAVLAASVGPREPDDSETIGAHSNFKMHLLCPRDSTSSKRDQQSQDATRLARCCMSPKNIFSQSALTTSPTPCTTPGDDDAP
jgi:hypothetical protein